MSEKSERDSKIFQSYIDNIKAKTGKSPKDFQALAKKKGLTQHGEIVAWLKSEFGLGHGHANAIVHLIKSEPTAGPAKGDDPVAGHFTGARAGWRKAYDSLAARIAKFGPDVEISPNRTYINLVRGVKKMTATPTTTMSAPSTSQRSGRWPSTHQPHSRLATTNTPPYAAYTRPNEDSSWRVGMIP